MALNTIYSVDPYPISSSLRISTPPDTSNPNFSSPDNDKPILRISNDNTYHVKFTWVCENIGGQTTQKNYKIQIKIKSDLDKNISGTLDNLEKLRDNPLGLQVVQYDVLDNRGDPLDSDTASW